MSETGDGGMGSGLTMMDLVVALSVIPCVEDLSESVDGVVGRRGMSESMRPHCKLRKALVRLEDRMERKDTCGVVCGVLCRSCKLKCTSGAGEKFNAGLGERLRNASDVSRVYVRQVEARVD